jgi:RNA polymerase sigma-70 factor (ECF subfamily)
MDPVPDTGRSRDADPQLAHAMGGDVAAFESFIRAHHASLWRLAYRLVGYDPSDVLQEAYIKVYKALPSLDPSKGTVQGWLNTIVYRACMDEIRRRNRVARLSANLGAEVTQGSSEDAFPDRDEVQAALSRLPLEQRALVFLIDAQGFSYREAAEMLNLPPGTVASRLHHARRVLRTGLNREGDDRHGT